MAIKDVAIDHEVTIHEVVLRDQRIITIGDDAVAANGGSRMVTLEVHGRVFNSRIAIVEALNSEARIGIADFCAIDAVCHHNGTQCAHTRNTRDCCRVTTIQGAQCQRLVHNNVFCEQAVFNEDRTARRCRTDTGVDGSVGCVKLWCRRAIRRARVVGCPIGLHQCFAHACCALERHSDVTGNGQIIWRGCESIAFPDCNFRARCIYIQARRI